MAGEFGVFGRDSIDEASELAVRRGKFLLGGATLRAGQCLRLGDMCSRSWLLGGRGMGRQPQILVNAAGQMPQPAVEDRVLLVGDPLEQIPVVRDDNQGARPRVE